MEDRGKQLREWLLQIVKPDQLADILIQYKKILESELEAVNSTLSNPKKNPGKNSKSFEINVE
jgi:hypothetical protein